MMNNMIEQEARNVVPNAQTQALIGRQSQEVQAAVFMAKSFPRDEQQSINRCLMAAKRRSLAQVAVYEYPRGGTRVTGPSIRLAEALAQNWGNIDTGVIELERRNGESTAMAYAWDLETNYRQTKTFTVKHVRETKKGTTALTDSRDIYELIANQGARRQRACILGVIPGDVVDMMVSECEKTLSTNAAPLGDRVRQMCRAFEEYGITTAMLEASAGMNVNAFTEQTVLKFERMYVSLRDGMAQPEDLFDFSVKNAQAQPQAPAQSSAAQGVQMTNGQIDMSQLGRGGHISDEDVEAAQRFAEWEAQGKFEGI